MLFKASDHRIEYVSPKDFKLPETGNILIILAGMLAVSHFSRLPEKEILPGRYLTRRLDTPKEILSEGLLLGILKSFRRFVNEPKPPIFIAGYTAWEIHAKKIGNQFEIAKSSKDYRKDPNHYTSPENARIANDYFLPLIAQRIKVASSHDHKKWFIKGKALPFEKIIANLVKAMHDLHIPPKRIKEALGKIQLISLGGAVNARNNSLLFDHVLIEGSRDEYLNSLYPNRLADNEKGIQGVDFMIQKLRALGTRILIDTPKIIHRLQKSVSKDEKGHDKSAYVDELSRLENGRDNTIHDFFKILLNRTLRTNPLKWLPSVQQLVHFSMRDLQTLYRKDKESDSTRVLKKLITDYDFGGVCAKSSPKTQIFQKPPLDSQNG